jgi:hypothetical protein
MINMGKSIALMMSLMWVSNALAIDPVLKCQETKLKAQGKLEQCLKNNSAKVLGGGVDLSATCQEKFTKALVVAGARTPCRYVDNMDGTVSDLDTGLQWEKKDHFDGISASGNVHDADNSYEWDNEVLPHFLDGLNGTSPLFGGPPPTLTGCFAGHCDWRLPTLDELIGIIDPTKGFCIGGSGACIDPVFGPTQANPPNNGYWTSTRPVPNATLVWFVDFTFGGRLISENTSNYVRAVRGGFGQ